MHQLDRYRRDIGRLGGQRRYGFCEKPHSLAVRRAASARILATLPQRQAARIVIRHPFNPAPHPAASPVARAEHFLTRRWPR